MAASEARRRVEQHLLPCRLRGTLMHLRHLNQPGLIVGVGAMDVGTGTLVMNPQALEQLPQPLRLLGRCPWQRPSRSARRQRVRGTPGCKGPAQEAGATSRDERPPDPACECRLPGARAPIGTDLSAGVLVARSRPFGSARPAR